jgi:hypothetical protein
VTSIGVFTPEQARMLWQDYLARQQLPAQQTQHFPQRRPVEDVAQHRVLVKNTTEEEIPQFACMRVTGVSLVGDRTVIEVEKPSSTDGEFLFNCEYAIPVEDTEADPPQYGVGWAYRYGIVRALGPEPDEAGELYGPVVDSWEIEPGGTLFNVFGRDDRNENGLIGRFAGGGGGGGLAIMHFRITEVDCDLYGSGWWCVEPTHYTGACSEPPGKDPYDGKYYVRPFCGSPFTQDELEATGTGVATFTYDLETCEQFWLEISHCADQGC